MAAEATVSVKESEVLRTEEAIEVLLVDDAISNGMYGFVGAAGDMTVPCIGIVYDVIRTAITDATTHTPGPWQQDCGATINFCRDRTCTY